MSLPPESIQVGQCYLTTGGHVRRVLSVLPGDVVRFEQRMSGWRRWMRWKAGVTYLYTFASLVEHPVPCDWTPERDERS